jgi:hypothetical protein
MGEESIYQAINEKALAGFDTLEEELEYYKGLYSIQKREYLRTLKPDFLSMLPRYNNDLVSGLTIWLINRRHGSETPWKPCNYCSKNGFVTQIKETKMGHRFKCSSCNGIWGVLKPDYAYFGGKPKASTITSKPAAKPKPSRKKKKGKGKTFRLLDR